MPTILKLDNWPKYMLWLHSKPPANSSSGWEEELFLVQLKQAMWSRILIVSNTRWVPQDGTQSQNITKLKTISRTKALLTVHYFLHDAFFFLPLLWDPRKQKSPHPILSKFSSITGPCSFLSPPAVRHCHRPHHQMEESRNLPGEPAVMVLELGQQKVLHVPCVWYLSPKIHDQAHYFYTIISPQQSKGPWPTSIMNPYLPDGSQWLICLLGTESLLAQQGSRVRELEMKLRASMWCQGKTRQVKHTCCRKNLNTPVSQIEKISTRNISAGSWYRNCACISQKPYACRQTAHTVLTGKVSFPHFWHRTPGSALPRRPSCVRTDKRRGHKRRDASQLLKNSQLCYWFLPAVSKRNAAFISFTGLQNVAVFSS